MPFKFEGLKVWQASLELGEKINVLADKFPQKEIFNLSSQIRRAADSIGLNIAEGSSGHTNAEQKRFLLFSNRSVLEVVACIIKAKHRNYINETIFADLYQDCEVLSKMLSSFIKSLD
ncbi:MAG: four helix bundle protein [Bacteroidota bacterium]|nr:four helix bundle protein [Bacteroidota bacterium]